MSEAQPPKAADAGDYAHDLQGKILRSLRGSLRSFATDGKVYLSLSPATALSFVAPCVLLRSPSRPLNPDDLLLLESLAAHRTSPAFMGPRAARASAAVEAGAGGALIGCLAGTALGAFAAAHRVKGSARPLKIAAAALLGGFAVLFVDHRMFARARLAELGEALELEVAHGRSAFGCMYRLWSLTRNADDVDRQTTAMMDAGLLRARGFPVPRIYLESQSLDRERCARALSLMNPVGGEVFSLTIEEARASMESGPSTFLSLPKSTVQRILKAKTLALVHGFRL